MACEEEVAMDHTNQVYEHLRAFIKKNGYPQSCSQMAKELNLKKYEVEEAIEELQRTGRIKVK